MNIFSPSNGKISKNLVDSIIGLSETISENPHVFKNIISGLVSETEAEKVKPEVGKVKPLSSIISETEVGKVKPLSSIISEIEAEKVKPSDIKPLFMKKIMTNKMGSTNKSSQEQESLQPRQNKKNKYYSQTADMQQKYLKYKNKYLLLKQELGV
jgi:hypothetical protein